MDRWLPFVLCSLHVFFGYLHVSAQYRFDSWTTDNGLPQNGVRTITQAPDGYLWFTTLDGLVRFNGVKFTVFNSSNSKGIINNRFWIIRAMNDGALWSATEGGDLTVYRDGGFVSYPAASVPGEQILDFKTDESGETQIETAVGFYYLRNGDFVFGKSTENDRTPKLVVRGNFGSNWVITPNETRREKDGDTQQTYSLRLKNVDFYSGAAYEDRNGGLWIGDVGELYYLRDDSITKYTPRDGLPPNVWPHRFWEESDGSLWFATGGYTMDGVGLVRLENGRFTSFGTERGLSNARIFDVFKDREGTVWVATNKGLNHLRPQVVSSISKADGLIENETYPIMKTRNGDVIIGTTGGLSRYRDGKIENTSPHFDQDSTNTVSVQSLFEDSSGRIWVGVSGGLFVIENGKATDLTKMFETTVTIWAIHEDHDGNIWFATDRNGVFLYKDGRIIANYTTANGLASNDVKVMYEASDGSIWFGTSGGLSHFTAGNFVNYTRDDGLASDLVRTIHVDDGGTMWIGTYDGGISRFKDNKFFNFTTENGLFNNGAFALMEDKYDNFWISCNKGIYRVNKNQLNDFADQKITSYTSFAYGKQDGMLNTECNGGRHPSAMADSDGRIWFPTLEGVAIVDPGLVQKNLLPPPVIIESVKIDHENMSLKDTVDLDPTRTQLDITYTGLSFIKSDQIHFRYKLEGLDKDWIDAETRRTVSYTHLPPGNYTFVVTAANSDGVWNNEGRSIGIVVHAPFYKTWGFLALLTFIGLCIGFVIYNNRIRHLKKLNAAQEAFSRQLIESQEAERKRIARELHDGLGQSLLIIKNRAALGLNANVKERADEQFDEIQESVTDALSEVRVIAHNLRPLHLERLGLTSTIEEMIEQVDEASTIEINCDIAPVDDLFTKENEINFYRIVQECLNNIVKHSNSTKASVEVSVEAQHIILSITDNGSGFDTEEVNKRRGLGLNGLEERLKILGGTITVESSLGNGTTVLVDITLEKTIKKNGI
ncbi:MAG: two-component regulator propeller domain-containing protein [Pyrinomonadaceae bacterium]